MPDRKINEGLRLKPSAEFAERTGDAASVTVIKCNKDSVAA